MRFTSILLILSVCMVQDTAANVPGDQPKPDILKVDIAPHRFELRATSAQSYRWKLLHREHHFGKAAPEALACLPMEDDSDS